MNKIAEKKGESVNKLLENLWQEKIEIITSENLKEISKKFYYNYETIINYLIKKEQILKIFDNIYYVKSPNEVRSRDFKLKYNPLELLSKGLEFKNNTKWYFGLHTALRHHGISITENKDDYLLSENSLFKTKKINLLGKNITSLIFKSNLFQFGIIKNDIRYSDLEKTFLDFIYLWKYKNIPNHKIISKLEKYHNILSQEIINEYAIYYPSNVIKLIEEFFNVNNKVKKRY
ncbi:MAG: hypothetical protein ACFFBP_12270 [Promethearchaeota archaeon]